MDYVDKYQSETNYGAMYPSHRMPRTYKQKTKDKKIPPSSHLEEQIGHLSQRQGARGHVETAQYKKC